MFTIILQKTHSQFYQLIQLWNSELQLSLHCFTHILKQEHFANYVEMKNWVGSQKIDFLLTFIK